MSEHITSLWLTVWTRVQRWLRIIYNKYLNEIIIKITNNVYMSIIMYINCSWLCTRISET